MRLDWAIPCTAVTVDQAIVTAIENGCFDVISVTGVPCPIEFVALCRFAGLPSDFAEDADRSVEAYLLGPAMGQVVELSFELPSGEPDSTHPEGWEMNAVIPIIVQFTAEAEGAYGLDFYIGGKYQKASFTFRILVGGPPQA